MTPSFLYFFQSSSSILNKFGIIGKLVYLSLKVRLYSALFTVRCGALTHITLKFELEYDNAPHRTTNDAEYELTL